MIDNVFGFIEFLLKRKNQIRSNGQLVPLADIATIEKVRNGEDRETEYAPEDTLEMQNAWENETRPLLFLQDSDGYRWIFGRNCTNGILSPDHSEVPSTSCFNLSRKAESSR